jgi:hypothetical protein
MCTRSGHIFSAIHGLDINDLNSILFSIKDLEFFGKKCCLFYFPVVGS